jgi:hypothetical protein
MIIYNDMRSVEHCQQFVQDLGVNSNYMSFYLRYFCLSFTHFKNIMIRLHVIVQMAFGGNVDNKKTNKTIESTNLLIP